MSVQDEKLGASVLEQHESSSFGKALNDTYQANCSPWQLASVGEGQGASLLSTLIDLKHPTTYAQCLVDI